MKIRQTRCQLLTLGLTLSLAACAANGPVKEADKDTGVFNGNWQGDVQKSALTQSAGNWELSCNIGKPSIPMKVQNGVVSFYYGDKLENTFINSAGQFRFNIPLKQKATASARSDVSLDRGQTNLVINGNLKKLKGRLVFAVEEFGGSGCSATIRFKKAGASV